MLGMAISWAFSSSEPLRVQNYLILYLWGWPLDILTQNRNKCKYWLQRAKSTEHSEVVEWRKAFSLEKSTHGGRVGETTTGVVWVFCIFVFCCSFVMWLTTNKWKDQDEGTLDVQKTVHQCREKSLKISKNSDPRCVWTQSVTQTVIFDGYKTGTSKLRREMSKS